MPKPTRISTAAAKVLPFLLATTPTLCILGIIGVLKIWGTDHQSFLLILSTILVFPSILLSTALINVLLEERNWWNDFHAELNDPLHITTFNWGNFKNEFWSHVEQTR